MRSKLAKRSRSDTSGDASAAQTSSARRRTRRGSTAIGLLGRLPEVEALAEVDAELAHRLELVDALDALGDDAAALLVGDTRRARRRAGGGAGGVLDAGGHRAVDLADVGAQQLEAGERLGAAGEVVERDERAALAVRVDELLSRSRSGQRSGRMSSRQMRDGSAPRRRDDRPGGAQRGLDVEHGARVEVDEQQLALGQQRQADLERGGAGAGVEGEERVVGLGGGHQLAAAQLDRAELAAHQRLAAEGARRWRGR